MGSDFTSHPGLKTARLGGIALFRFLHTSDLHLGKRFGQMPEGLRGRLTEARHQSITRLNDAAAERAVDTILVAGDVFDTETPAPATVRQALQAMGARPQVRWFLMPGNHDSLQTEELWGRVANEAPGNVVLLLRPKPVALAANVMLLPAPCPVHRPGRDLSEWMSNAETSPETIRIGLAHGSVQAVSRTQKFEIPGIGTLAVNPGAGHDETESTALLSKQENFRRWLDELGLTDLAALRERQHQHMEISADLRVARAELATLVPNGIEALQARVSELEN